MKKKPIHELAKEFPNTTYRELEKYRDADRWQEAQRILIKDEKGRYIPPNWDKLGLIPE